MPKIISISTLILIFSLMACQKELKKSKQSEKIFITSPDEINSIYFKLNEEGIPLYWVTHNDKIVIDKSKLSFDFLEDVNFSENLKITGFGEATFDKKWEMPWGEQKEVIDQYNELRVFLENSKQQKINICFRAYDDGVALRYEFPEQESIESLSIAEERTEFKLTEDYTTWWIPGDWDIYEHLYNTTPLSEVNALSKENHGNLAQTYIPENAVNTPVTMRSKDGLHLSFHEANLTNYAGMTLKVDTTNLKLTSDLVGSERMEYKVKRDLPFKTPWRSIQIADEAKDLIDSKLIVNLNEPNKLGEIDWFTPQKYVGIWWEMHVDKATWDYGMTMNDEGKWEDTGQAHGRHGATTENTKRYIDFAAANNIKGILVEGWNTGWERWIGFEDREGVFDFITPYPDYDIKALSDYAKSKGVELIMHHETSAAVTTYEEQLEPAFQLMQDMDMHLVKTGYVGKIIPKGEYHHGQWMVNHYRNVLETAAKYKVAINAHEPIKPTGIRRTLPNAVSREGLRGQEFNAWASDGGNPPEHLPIVAFTRMLAGPIDFTPGVFDIALPTKPDNQINTTLAQQLALYVVIYSPIQMACDLPENYENQPGFQFIRDVGVDWQQSITLNGEIGDYVNIARQERETGNWFVGGITDENARTIDLDFSFLEEGKTYQAKLYKDAKDAHYKTNPTALDIESLEINHSSSLSIDLKEGGGFAMSLVLVE